jgi:NADH kinase
MMHVRPLLWGYYSSGSYCIVLYQLILITNNVCRHLRQHYPHLKLIIEPHTARDHPGLTSDCIVCHNEDERLLPLHSNMVITLGGDGTILHVSHLFGEGECPPVLSFSMGSLGFLLPFRKFL